MKAIALYHPNSEHARKIEELATHMDRFKATSLDLQSLETREGAEKARVYDITNYPAVLIIDDQGSLVRLWQGGTMPLLDEISAYFR